jgi:hypothetical protein
MASHYEVRDYMHHSLHYLIVCFLITLHVSASELIKYSQNITKKIEKLIPHTHTPILNSDDGAVLHNSKPTRITTH